MLLCQGGRQRRPVWWLHCLLVGRGQCPVDGTGEVPFQAAQGFFSALPFGLFAGKVRACGRIVLPLGDGDPVV